jgi:hypothetical protein
LFKRLNFVYKFVTVINCDISYYNILMMHVAVSNILLKISAELVIKRFGFA